jgi:hypothetical protein
MGKHSHEAAAVNNNADQLTSYQGFPPYMSDIIANLSSGGELGAFR